MIKLALFDVDGVLLNGDPLRIQLERDYGITQAMSASFFRERFRACLIGRLDTREELAVHLPQWGWKYSIDDFFAYWFASRSALNEPLFAFIQDMRQSDIPCYIATNQEKYRTAYLLERMGFAKTFDGMFSSASIGYLKDDVAFFFSILDQLHLIPPDEILFWDDLVVHVKTARQAGLQAEQYVDFLDFSQKMQKYSQ